MSRCGPRRGRPPRASTSTTDDIARLAQLVINVERKVDEVADEAHAIAGRLEAAEAAVDKLATAKRPPACRRRLLLGQVAPWRHRRTARAGCRPPTRCGSRRWCAGWELAGDVRVATGTTEGRHLDPEQDRPVPLPARRPPGLDATPVLVVYALINKPYILDLRPGNSFVGHLLREG